MSWRRSDLRCNLSFCYFFFFNDTATTEIYTLSLHDALPICPPLPERVLPWVCHDRGTSLIRVQEGEHRSEEHTSELQSRPHLVCRLLLEKKKNKETYIDKEKKKKIKGIAK